MKPFFVCVYLVLIKDGKTLLPKVKREPFKGYWHVVGGHVEENETLKEALKRESKESDQVYVGWRVTSMT